MQDFHFVFPTANKMLNFGRTSVGFALLIAASILASSTLDILTGEWRATSGRTKKLLAVGLAVVLLFAVIPNFGRVF